MITKKQCFFIASLVLSGSAFAGESVIQDLNSELPQIVNFAEKDILANFLFDYQGQLSPRTTAALLQLASKDNNEYRLLLDEAVPAEIKRDVLIETLKQRSSKTEGFEKNFNIELKASSGLKPSASLFIDLPKLTDSGLHNLVDLTSAVVSG